MSHIQDVLVALSALCLIEEEYKEPKIQYLISVQINNSL